MRKEFTEKLKKLNPEKLRKLLRDRQKRYRQRKKKEKAKQRDKKITQEMRSGNLNYGLKADNSFMSFEEYKKSFPNATKGEYVRAKIKHDQDKAKAQPVIRDTKTEILGNVPVLRATAKTCIRVRKMHLGLIPFDALEVDSHNTCDLCHIWYAKNKRRLPLRKWTSFDLFHGHENQPRHGVPNEESKKLIHEEMKKLYGENYREEWTE